MPSDKKVLVLYSEASGGMAHYAEHLHEGLAGFCQSSLRCISINDGASPHGGMLRLLERNKVIFKLRRKYNRFRYYRVARQLVKEFQPDHVHFSHFFSGARELVRIFRRHRVGVSLTIHDPTPHEENRTRWGSFLNGMVRRTRLPQTLSLVDRVHVHSPLHKTALQKLYPQLQDEQFYIVQHGGGASKTICDGKIIPPELARLTSAPECPVILFFGRIEPYKGLSVLFEAIDRMLLSKSDFFVVVAGGGALPAVPESIRDRLILVNRFIRDEEIAALFKSASFTVLPYISGTQTGVIPLASTFGLPSVVTRVGALPELILENQTGLLVAPGDADDLAKALLFYLNHPEQAESHGAAARKFLEQHYSWEQVGGQHCQEFERIAVSRSKRQALSC